MGATLRDRLVELCTQDVEGLVKAQENYGDSWKKRGGVGAFMMLARKWDRLERAVEQYDWDVSQAVLGDRRAEGIIDDMRDLRRYLLLVEMEWGHGVPEINK